MKGKSGFTLVELLVVMLIIATLAGLGTGGYRLARRQAKESAAAADIERFKIALEEFRIEFGAYPADEGTMREVFSALDDSQLLVISNSVPGLIFEDPWGRPYRYLSTNRYQFRVWSEGFLENDASDDVDPGRGGL